MLLLEVIGLKNSAAAGGSFGLRRTRKKILQSVSLGIGECTTVGLVGPSGSGKSTLARCLAGLQRPDGGRIIFSGTDIFPKQRNRTLIGTSIQLIFQDPVASFDPRMRVFDSLVEAAPIDEQSNTLKTAGNVRMLLESVRLNPDVMGRFPRELSGGQLQRLAIARSILARPRLMILDEPTSALDPISQVAVLTLLRSLQVRIGFSILYITHDLKGALAFCERIAVLAEGRITEEDSSANLAGRKGNGRTPEHS